MQAGQFETWLRAKGLSVEDALEYIKGRFP